MENTNIKTAETVRVEKLEKDKHDQFVRRQSLALTGKQYELSAEKKQYYNGNYEKMNSPMMDSIVPANYTTNEDESSMNKKTDIEN